MATYSAATAVHKTSGVATVDTVTLTDNSAPLEVLNRGTVDPLFVTVGLTTSLPANPTVAGDDTYIVPPGSVRTLTVTGADTSTDYVVKLIAASATAYSVRTGGQ